MASRPEEDDAQAQEVVPMPPSHSDVAGMPVETRWPPFTLRQHAGFWLPEVTLTAGVAAVHSGLEARPSDVLLATFPKSGTTWLKALAFATVHRSTHPPLDGEHPLRQRSPHECVRFLEIHLSTRAELEALPSPRVLATHLPYAYLPTGVQRQRIVYLCRDPKDALVSYWLFTRKAAAPARGVDARSFTMEEALELFCQGRCPSGPQWQHALRYWEESVRRPHGVLFLRYEEMLREPERELRRLAGFLGCGFSDEEERSGVVRAIVDLCSLPRLKEVNRNGTTKLGVRYESFFRKGVAGDWRNHLTPEIPRRLDEVVQDALQGTGFTFATS